MSTSRYTVGEEIANSITHGAGVILAIAALTVMVSFSALRGDAWHVVSTAIFGATLIISYTTSTLYHSIPLPKVKPILRTLDHSAIFLLIAGTYTPLLLVSLRGPWGWSLFATVWSIAILGIVLRLVLNGRRHGLIVSLYVAMGWVILVAAVPLLEHMETNGLLFLLGGGICYTLGVAFYVWRRLPYHHAIWHLFVLGGSTLHFFTILLYVIP
jgi:hemolysin III